MRESKRLETEAEWKNAKSAAETERERTRLDSEASREQKRLASEAEVKREKQETERKRLELEEKRIASEAEREENHIASEAEREEKRIASERECDQRRLDAEARARAEERDFQMSLIMANSSSDMVVRASDSDCPSASLATQMSGLTLSQPSASSAPLGDGQTEESSSRPESGPSASGADAPRDGDGSSDS